MEEDRHPCARERAFGPGRAPWLLFCIAMGCSSAPPVRAPDAVSERRAAAVDLVERARGLARQSDWVRAEQYLGAAIALGASSAEITPLLVRVCVAAHHHRAATLYARAHLEAHPEDASLRYLLATLLVALGDFPAAVEQLQRLIEVQPTHASSHFLLGRLYLEEIRDARRADAALRAYLRLDPAGAHAARARAALLRPVRRGPSAPAPPGEER